MQRLTWVVEAQAMCPGKACTSGTSCVRWVRAAAPHTPLLRGCKGGGRGVVGGEATVLRRLCLQRVVPAGEAGGQAGRHANAHAGRGTQAGGLT